MIERGLSIMVLGLLVPVALVFSGPPSTQFDFSKHNVPLEQILSGGPTKDGIPSILQPVFLKTADAQFLTDQDRILGIVDGEEAKAYPIKILNWHEIVNDMIEGKPVVITYCPLCGTGIAFRPIVNGRSLTFGVSGLLYQSDMVMYDHQTESLWSQISMEAIAGPMTGTNLTPIFLEHTTWGEWRRAHPSTVVLSTQTGHVRDYQRDPYLGYAQRADLIFPVQRRDSRYHAKEWVLGLTVNGAAKAYPFSELKKAESPLEDEVNGQRLIIQFNSKTQSALAFDVEGKPIPTVMAFWFAWYAFHPETEVFTAS